MWPKCLSINGTKTLVIGIGGGYDIYTCLPWFLGLSKEEKDLCLLANYTFSDDIHTYTTTYVAEIGPNTIRTEKNSDYFPEHHLAKHLDKIIYTFRLMPCPLLLDIMESFIKKHNIGQIIMFDGGIDSIIFGNESCNGSPMEDSQMVIACVKTATKFNIPCVLVVSALGIDDCDNNAYLEHWKMNATYGTYCIDSNLPYWTDLKHIVQSTNPASIIQECIIAAGEGKRGLYINPRLYPDRIDDPNDFPIIRSDTNLYWCWDPVKLIEMSPFYQELIKWLETSETSECWLPLHKKVNEILNKRN